MITRSDLITRGPILRRWILLTLIAGVPLFFFRAAYDPINVPKFSLLLTGVAAAAALRGVEFFQGARSALHRRDVAIAVALVLPLVIAWVFSPYKTWALFGEYGRLTGLVPYLTVALFGLLIADAFAGRTEEIAWALVVAGGLTGAYAVIQAMGLDPLKWSVEGTNTDLVVSSLGNPNFAGAFLGIVLPVGIHLTLSDKGRWRFSIPALLLVAAGCLVARSEGGYAAAVAGASVVVGFWLSSRLSFARILGLAGALSVTFLAVGSVAFLGIRDPGSASTLARRAQWWEAAAAMAADSPIVGKGPGAFAVEHAEYRTPEDARQVNFDITNDPHSIVMSYAASAGAIGAGGVLFAFVSLYRRGWALDAKDSLGGAMFGGVVAYIVQALVSVDTIALRTAFWSVAGGLIASGVSPVLSKKHMGSTKKRKVKSEPVRNPVGITVVVLTAVACLWLSGKFLTSDTSFSDSLMALDDGQITPAQEEYQQATGLRKEIFYRRSYGRAIGGLAVALTRAGEEAPARALLASAREAFGFIDDIPSSNSMVDLARLLRDTADINPSGSMEALEIYERAASIDRYNAPLLEEASALALQLEEEATVVELVADFPALNENAQLLGNLALAYARLGQATQARESATMAIELVPSQLQALDALRLLDPEQ